MSAEANPISVLAAFYRNETDAHEMLTQLNQMDKDGTIDIVDDAVLVMAEDGSHLKINETGELTAKKGGLRGALVGGVLGIIFPPSILAMAAVGAAAGAALGHFTDQGFDNNVLKDIGENLPPGGSCIIAVVEETWVSKLATALEGYADLARYTLKPETAAKLIAALER